MSSTAEGCFALMTGHIELATVELFGACGIPLRPAAPRTDRSAATSAPSVAAVVGYAGEQLRGSLLLLAATSTIEAWMRVMDEEGVGPREVLGEFSLELVGHLKTRLSNDGIALYLSTPTTAEGLALTFDAPSDPATWLAFEGPGATRLEIRIACADGR